MPTFVQFNVERIQAYLARTDQLAARRAASSMVTEMLSLPVLTQVAGWADAQEATNDEPDGKLTVELPSAPSPADIERAVITLGRGAPGTQLTATSVEATNVEDAKSAFYRTAPTCRLLPAVLDEPFGRPCDWCGHDTAVATVKVHERVRSLCRDCKLRHNNRSKSRTKLERQLERDLGKSVPQEMGALAALCPPVRGKPNHLATIYIDGNNLGRVFASIKGAAEAALVSAVIDTGVKAALKRATAEITTATMPNLAVIPHVCAGDDVLVSVPAPLALDFVKAFHVATDEAINHNEVWSKSGAVRFTSGAGIVVSLAKHPFRDLVDLADRQISIAKKAWQGRENAFAYLDLTTDGPHPPEHRIAWATAWLERIWPDLNSLAFMDNSARSELAALLAAPGLTRSDRFQQVQQAARQRNWRLPDRFQNTLGPGDLSPQPPGSSLDSYTGRAQLLIDALAMTKRWPKPSGRAAESSGKEQ